MEKMLSAVPWSSQGAPGGFLQPLNLCRLMPQDEHHCDVELQDSEDMLLEGPHFCRSVPACRDMSSPLYKRQDDDIDIRLAKFQLVIV